MPRYAPRDAPRAAPRDAVRVVPRLLCLISLTIVVQTRRTRHLALRAFVDVFHACQFRIRHWKRWKPTQVYRVSCHGPEK